MRVMIMIKNVPIRDLLAKGTDYVVKTALRRKESVFIDKTKRDINFRW